MFTYCIILCTCHSGKAGYKEQNRQWLAGVTGSRESD